MEIQIPSYSIIFAFFCFLLVIHRLNSSRKPLKKLPPGPPRLPIIGNLHQLSGELPHRALTNLANKYGPFMYLQLGALRTIIVSSPEYAKEIMKTHDHIFANRPRLLATDIIAYDSSNITFSPYGNYWRQLRKICTLELLSTKRVQSFRKIRVEEISALVKYISQQEGCAMNLSTKLYALTNSVVARAAFGKKTKNVDEMVQVIEDGVKVTHGLSVSDVYPDLKFLSVITGMRARIVKVHLDTDRCLGNIIREHKERGSPVAEADEDLVDVLLRVQKESDLDLPLTDDNLKAAILDIFFAGTETTAKTTEWAMAELLRNPETMKEAQAEVRRIFGDKGSVDETELHKLKYVQAVLKETLRLHPPAAMLVPRESSENCEIDGYEIPAKTRIIINAWAIGRDPKNWDNVEKFDPKRFLNTSEEYNFRGSDFKLIPFGAGRRICPGILFASATLELLLANLLYHFDWQLPNGLKPEEMDMEESFGITVKRKTNLVVRPIAYCP